MSSKKLKSTYWITLQRFRTRDHHQHA